MSNADKMSYKDYLKQGNKINKELLAPVSAKLPPKSRWGRNKDSKPSRWAYVRNKKVK